MTDYKKYHAGVKYTGIMLVYGGVLLCCGPSQKTESQLQRETPAATTTLATPSTEDHSTIYKTDNLVIRKVSEHCYIHTSYLNTTDFGRVACNGMLIVNNDTTVVFDTPSDNASSDELIRFIVNELKSNITGFIATHFHEDCVGGLEVFIEHQIPSYASEKTIALLKKKERKHIDVLRGFNDNLRLPVGDKNVQVRYFGEGHTQDNVIGYYAGDQVMFGGCLIKEVGASKGNLEDANVDAWPATVRKIKEELPAIKVVIPGHGKAGGKELLDYTIQLFE